MRLKFDFDQHELSLAKLGFGTWGLGGSAYGRLSSVKAKNVISYAFKNGVRIFDTSPLYGAGRSEKLLGEVLASKSRSTFMLISKAGLTHDGKSEQRNFTSRALNNSLYDSLSRLQTNYLDYFLLHSPTPKEILHEQRNHYGLKTAINSKAILNFGVSLKSPNDFSHISNDKLIKSIEFNYSLMDQRASFLDADSMKRGSIYKIARTPYNFGFLTESPPKKSPPRSRFNHLRNWSQQQFDSWHEFRKIWIKIAHSNNMPLEELALAFVLSSNFVDVVIPGFMEITQVDAALNAARRGPLTEKSKEFLCEIYYETQSKYQVRK